MDKNDLVVVCGAGGFIGGHLVADLMQQGFKRIRAVDIKPLENWYQQFLEIENIQSDLKERPACERACRDARYVFNLAADMGGMGFIENHKAECMLSVLINTHLLLAATHAHVERYFFASSACVYAAQKQTLAQIAPLKESDAYPAMPEDGYGWEKLFSERMCRHFSEDYGIQTRVARYHNVYGPHGTYDGGREKAPAALCRKVIQAKLSGDLIVPVWGDGEQTRSFTFIDDCVFGTKLIMDSNHEEPINLGSDELVSINQLIDLIEKIADIQVERQYQLDAPLGVRGRNSDNTLIQNKLSWKPSTSLREGLEKTYHWIYEQMVSSYAKFCCKI
jgi:GDP-D-mannose 3',5'-epimerase